MTNFGFWCATALLLLVASSASVSGLLCQDSYETLESFSNRSIAHVHNSSYTVTTQGYEGRASFLSNGTFGLYGFQEANRSTNVKCIEADTFPYIEDKWLAKLFKFIRIGDMNCSSQRYLETVPGTDVQIKTLGFTATLDIYPDLVLSFNISTASAAGNYTFDYPTERVAEYESAEAFKYTIAVDNWPWTTETNTSYLVAVFHAELTTSEEGELRIFDQNEKVVSTLTTKGGLTISQSFDQGFYLDGEKFVHLSPPTVFPAVPVPANFTWEKVVSWAFCNYEPPGFQYKNAFYDPSLSLLFDLGDEYADKSAPKTKTARATWIAAIVVPIVIILIVAGIIIFFVFFKPKHADIKALRNGTGTSDLRSSHVH